MVVLYSGNKAEHCFVLTFRILFLKVNSFFKCIVRERKNSVHALVLSDFLEVYEHRYQRNEDQ